MFVRRIRFPRGFSPGRNCPECDPGDNGSQEGEPKDTDIDGDCRAWKKRKEAAVDELNRAVRDQEAQATAETGEQHAFRQRPTQEPGAPRAERGPDAVLANARGAPYQLQVREIGAGDQQDDASQSEREPHDVS